MNDIKTWQQGEFVDQRKYEALGDDWKADRMREEKHLVRPGLTENAICRCFDPQDADWVAKRLNLASKLEQMTYDFATGKTDGDDIVAFVRKTIDA